MTPSAASWHRWCMLGIVVSLSVLFIMSMMSSPSISTRHILVDGVDATIKGTNNGQSTPNSHQHGMTSLRETIDKLAATNAALDAREKDRAPRHAAGADDDPPSSLTLPLPAPTPDAPTPSATPNTKLSSSSSSCATTAKPFTIYVLTYDRPESLERLLASLRHAHYDGDCIALMISVDIPKSGTKPEHARCIAVAQQFEWNLGPKHVQVHTTNQGLLNQWVNIWRPSSDDETGIIFEDDLEPSPYYYKWWKQTYRRYGHLPEIVGLSLQRQYLVPAASRAKLRVTNGNKPFLYLLVGSWGYAPVARQWRQFIDWYNQLEAGFKPLTPGLVTSDWWATFDRQGKHGTMWTQHFIYWCDKHKRYTLYANPGGSYTLCSNWQEPGLHFGGKPMSNKADHERVLEWPAEFDQQPDQLGLYDWKAQLTGYLPAPLP